MCSFAATPTPSFSAAAISALVAEEAVRSRNSFWDAGTFLILPYFCSFSAPLALVFSGVSEGTLTFLMKSFSFNWPESVSAVFC